ncbi:MAG: response regulator, partial [Bdellovibrionota bacterium]|nr:response regulator [Bdellovibrionota bacterium]
GSQVMKILVVDDEEDVREIITDFIAENFDLEVLQAGTGMEAITALENETEVGLIIADYNFPDLGDGGVNGGGIYTFNLGNQNIPFFLFSAERPEDHQELDSFRLDNPLNTIIGKPYDHTFTKEAIKKVIISAQKRNKGHKNVT